MSLVVDGNSGLLGQLLFLVVGGIIGFAIASLLARVRRHRAERERLSRAELSAQDRARSAAIVLRDELDRAAWAITRATDYSNLARSIGDARRSLDRVRLDHIAHRTELKLVESAMNSLEASEGYMFFASRIPADHVLDLAEATAANSGTVRAIMGWLTAVLDEDRGELKAASDDLAREVQRLRDWTNRIGDQLDEHDRTVKARGRTPRRGLPSDEP
ncbi:hypothetical protein ACFQE5_21240 [Pseudonocardia hispaniensis]|uniref:Secreted protein n=1 Tax=Pseudonocardia hispaniensis TaxID=904933 RepID=A0ABW1J7T3_9PSEU